MQEYSEALQGGADPDATHQARVDWASRVIELLGLGVTDSLYLGAIATLASRPDAVVTRRMVADAARQLRQELGIGAAAASDKSIGRVLRRLMDLGAVVQVAVGEQCGYVLVESPSCPAAARHRVSLRNPPGAVDRDASVQRLLRQRA